MQPLPSSSESTIDPPMESHIQFEFFRGREMTFRVKCGFQLFVVVVSLSCCIPIDGLGTDYLTKLEHRRQRVQAELDLLIKYFCSYDQRDVNCQVRLPQLREELRQIDEQLKSYRNEDNPSSSYQTPDPHRELADLIRRRRFVLAEQDLLGHTSDVPAVVKEIYDDRGDNFQLLVDFATAIRNAERKFLVYKSILEEIIHRGHDEPLKVVRVIRGVQDEIVLGNSVDDETHTKATNMVDNLKILFETGVAKLWIDNTINESFERDASVPKLADEISTLDSDLFTRIIYKVVAAVYPLIDKHQLMRNMEKFHLLPQLIDGYNVIYNEMARAHDINGKPYILKLGYYCRELLIRSNATLVSPEKKTQLITLEQKLPTSIRSLVFNDRVCLKNKYIHDYLQIAHGHPRLTRYAIMAPGTQLRWIPKPLNYTTFFEFPYGGYLFADDENVDGRSRVVAASLDSDDMVVGSEWEVEPLGDDCLIRNTAYKELLYVGDEFDTDHLSNKVFTTIRAAASAGDDDRFKWTIEGC